MYRLKCVGYEAVTLGVLMFPLIHKIAQFQALAVGNDKEGKAFLWSMFERGEIFGERAVIDGLPPGADAYAEEETTFLVIPKERILPLLFQYPESMFCILQILCNRLLRYTETIKLFALGALPMRIAHCLLSLGHTYGEEHDGRILIRSGLSQADIAQKTGSTSESVNRQLKAFAAQGLIELRDDAIVVFDLDALKKICEQKPEYGLRD